MHYHHSVSWFREYWGKAFSFPCTCAFLGCLFLKCSCFIYIEASCWFPQGHRQLPGWACESLLSTHSAAGQTPSVLELVEAPVFDKSSSVPQLWDPQEASLPCNWRVALSVACLSPTRLVHTEFSSLAYSHGLHSPTFFTCCRTKPSLFSVCSSDLLLPCAICLFSCYFQWGKFYLHWFLYNFTISTFLRLWTQLSQQRLENTSKLSTAMANKHKLGCHEKWLTCRVLP